MATSTLRASVTALAAGLPAGANVPILIDGADSSCSANGLTGYTPTPGDRLLVQQVGGTLEGADRVTAVDLSSDGRWLLTGSADGSAQVWAATRRNSRPIGELLGHRGAVNDVRFHPRRPGTLVTAGNDGTARHGSASAEMPAPSRYDGA